jgi:hypothetical protein
MPETDARLRKGLPERRETFVVAQDTEIGEISKVRHRS